MKQGAAISYEPLLTDHIIAFNVEGAVADYVSPRVTSDEKGEYETYDGSSFKIPEVKPRVGMEKAKTYTLASGSAKYETHNLPLAMELTDKFVREQEKLGRNPRLTKSEQVKSGLIRAREKRIADLFLGAPNSVTLNPYNSETNKFLVHIDDKTNSHPFDILSYYIAYFSAVCGVYPSDVIFNPFVEYALAMHPDRDTKSNQSTDKIANASLGDKLLGMSIVRAFMPYDSTKPGRTGTNTFIWGNNIVLMYRAKDVSQTSPTASKTFDAGEAVRGVEGIAISEYDGDAGQPGMYIEGQEDIDEKITCPTAILVIKNVLKNAVPVLNNN